MKRLCSRSSLKPLVPLLRKDGDMVTALVQAPKLVGGAMGGSVRKANAKGKGKITENIQILQKYQY